MGCLPVAKWINIDGVEDLLLLLLYPDCHIEAPASPSIQLCQQNWLHTVNLTILQEPQGSKEKTLCHRRYDGNLVPRCSPRGTTWFKAAQGHKIWRRGGYGEGGGGRGCTRASRLSQATVSTNLGCISQHLSEDTKSRLELLEF